MYPETYIIDSKGKVLQKLAEPVDWMDPAHDAAHRLAAVE